MNSTPDAPELPQLLAELADMLPKVGEPEATWTMIRTSLARSLLAARQPEPVAWVLRPVKPRHKPFNRGIYGAKPTPEQYEIAALDGDEYIPLYADQPLTPPADLKDGWVMVAERADE